MTCVHSPAVVEPTVQRKRLMLLCQLEDGTEERIEYDGEPIHAGKVDSNHLASLFGHWDWVEQDDQYIHCGINQPLGKLSGDR